MTEQGECNGKDKNSKTVWVKNYYDNYDFRSQAGFNSSNFPAGTVNAKGYLTGSEVTVPGTTTKLYTAYYYDVKGRVTKTVQSNLLSGYDVTTTSYTFTGQPQTVTHTHTASGKTTLTEVYTYKYDYEDRLTQVQHKLGNTQVTLATPLSPRRILLGLQQFRFLAFEDFLSGNPFFFGLGVHHLVVLL